MLKKHLLSDATKTPGAEKALFGCWKSALCSKKTFSMLKKSAAQKKNLGKTVLEIRDFDSPTLWANDDIFPGLFLTFPNLALRFGNCDSPTPRENGVGDSGL